MTRLNKYAKADMSIQEKTLKQLKYCPSCEEYQPIGHKYKMYHCKLLGHEEKYGGIRFAIVSRKPCTLEDLYSCLLR